MDFCKAFNDATKKFPKGAPIPVKVYINKNKTFTLEINKPLTSYLLKQKAQIQKGSAMPNKDKVGSLTMEDIRSVAEEKLSDLNVNSIDAAMRTLIGSARSMGIEIREASNG
jgi:large subunit ribosomal protein L11